MLSNKQSVKLSQNILSEILDARENRGKLRQTSDFIGFSTLSLSLNVPGYPKSDVAIRRFFGQILFELKIFLNANRILIENEKDKSDSAGEFFIARINNHQKKSKEIKELCELFESQHPAGRIIDVDIFDENAVPISSGKVKKCFVCENASAIECMRNRNHGVEETRQAFLEIANRYTNQIFREQLIRRLSSEAVRALLYEISLTPKPGLVDFSGRGSHSDMIFFTFLDSTSVLSTHFSKFARAGLDFSSAPDRALAQIREIGLLIEHEMFETTRGINTQKGAIFLLGLSIFSSASVLGNNETIKPEDFRTVIKEICRNIVNNELHGTNPTIETHGEKCFRQFGLTGVRGEAENGFPSVFERALPVLQAEYPYTEPLAQEKIQRALQKTLATLISVSDDSNICFRRGMQAVNELKNRARQCFSSDFDTTYRNLCEFCKENHISPGGSADLLAVTIFFDRILKSNFITT